MKESLHYCSPAHGGWGPIRMTQLVPESQLLFCCPSACFRHGALGAFQHGYKNRMAYLYLTREDIIRGYDDILLEGAEEYLCRLEGRLKVLFLFVSCLDLGGTIGAASGYYVPSLPYESDCRGHQVAAAGHGVSEHDEFTSDCRDKA